MRDRWSYQQLAQPEPYGSDTTYEKGMGWLDGLPVIEDWGCGSCYAKRFLAQSRYVGVDGSASPWTAVVADLRYYFTSTPDGLFMRHVLEHNHDWKLVLANATRAFRRRFVLIIFTPFSETTHVIPTAVNGNGVPDISFAKHDLTSAFPGSWREETYATVTQYGTETIFYVER